MGVIGRYGQSWDGKPKVIVGTVHSVKGGEADTVILAPDLSFRTADEMKRLEASQEMGRTCDDIMDDALRMIYVGMTRARQKLIMLNPIPGRYSDGYPRYVDVHE